MGIREEIKSYIVRSGMTMTEVVDRLYDDYDWSRSVPNLSGKLRRASCDTKKPWSLRMCWTMTLSGSSASGKEIQWHKKHSTQFYALPNTRRGRQGHWKHTTERTKEKYASNPDIDISKSKDNFHIIQPTQKYRKEIDTRIKAAGCRTRKDSTMFVDTLITASPEFFTDRSKKEIQAYFTEAVAFMEKKVGPGEHLLRRGTHGRKNAPPPSVLHPHYGGRAAVRQGDFGQPGAALPMAGRVSRPHEKGVPRPQAGRERPCHQTKAHSHMVVQAVHKSDPAAAGHRKGGVGNRGAERWEEARRDFGDGGGRTSPGWRSTWGR